MDDIVPVHTCNTTTLSSMSSTEILQQQTEKHRMVISPQSTATTLPSVTCSRSLSLTSSSCSSSAFSYFSVNSSSSLPCLCACSVSSSSSISPTPLIATSTVASPPDDLPEELPYGEDSTSGSLMGSLVQLPPSVVISDHSRDEVVVIHHHLHHDHYSTDTEFPFYVNVSLSTCLLPLPTLPY